MFNKFLLIQASKHHKKMIKQSRSPFDLIINQIWRNKPIAETWPRSSMSRLFKRSESATELNRLTRKQLGVFSPDSEASVNKSTISDVETTAARWEEVVEFMDKLGKKPNHKCMNLNNGHLSTNDVIQLAALLPYLPTLEELDLSWNESIGGALKVLTNQLQHLPYLRVLELVSCQLSKLDISSLGDSIQLLANIEKIDLSWNPDLGGNLSLLTQKLHSCSTLKILKLVDCNLTAEDGVVLGKSLSVITNLEILDLSMNKNVGCGLAVLFQELSHASHLQVIKLCNCGLTPESIQDLAQIIPLLKNLQVVNLGLNKNIGDTMRHLIARIRFLPRFKNLTVNGCNLTKETIVELADTLPNLTDLETLDLSWNKCLGGNLGVLFQMLENKTGLQVLKLCSCNLTGQDLATLVSLSSIGLLSSLKMLHLTYNNTVDDQSWVTFFQEINGLQELSELDIGLMPLSHRDCSPWFTVLLSCLSRLPSLVELGMHHWVITASQCELLDAFNKHSKRSIHFTY
ncbi:leucine-rich repeat-containing protein 31-like isoform X4 [Narcine bancroftii]|uniref:leucine-rich repeat-containing protein 31-like isoform X4 n=1 Tax=Narcine bancroftii TaxID=1343680 RepID=UPI0038312C2A